MTNNLSDAWVALAIERASVQPVNEPQLIIDLLFGKTGGSNGTADMWN